MEPPLKKQKLDDISSKTEAVEICKPAADFTEDVDTEADKFAESDDIYDNFVPPEELDRLREFQVLDEVKSNDEDSNDEESDSSDGKSDVPEEEIEKMLEEDLPEDFKGAPKPKEKPYITKQKIVLEEKGVNHFEVLPLDWMVVRHYSGMPVYMHRTTRVCTLSKPYFLGKGNTRRHDIPISAIPCLAYRKALEEEEKQKEIDEHIEEQIKSGSWQQNVDKNQREQINATVNKKTDSTGEVQNSSETNVPRCPYLHGNILADTNNQIPPNHDLLISERLSKESVEMINTELNKVEQNATENVLSNEAESIPIIDVKSNLEISDSQTEQKGMDDKKAIDYLCKESKVTGASIEKENLENEVGIKLSNENSKINRKDESTVETSENIVNDSEDKSTNANEAVDHGSKSETPLNRQPVVLPGGIVMPPPRVETVSTSWKTQHLTPDQVNNYCKKLFVFKTVNIMHFKRWADRRKYTKARKTLQYPTLPEGTKLITIPASNGHDQAGGKASKRDWVMNMNGRSYLSVFHEYVRRALQKQPVYEFKQLENASTPYQATVYIGGMQYGAGLGSSKRAAKSAAARASIHILIPEMRAELDAQPTGDEPDFSFFDYLGIEDPRITEFCAATCEPSPHAILRTCLLRNFGAGDKHIHTEMKKLEYQKIELTMKVGKHAATVVCKNKKTAKQRASQAILQALHPHVRSWGSLLRLYGSRSVKSCKEKKLEEQQITLLQDAARHNQPNHAVLDKLRHEMGKLRARDRAVVPIGTLLLPHRLPEHSGSNLNNVDL